MIQSEDPSQVETYLLICSLVHDLEQFSLPPAAAPWLRQARITAHELKSRLAPKVSKRDKANG